MLGACLLAVAPRALSHFSLFSSHEIAPPQNPAREERRNRSLSNALAKIDAATLRAYVERWTNPEKAGVSNARPAIYIDPDALERRHPAWRLANEMERGAVSPSSPRILRALAPISVENRLAGDPGKAPQSPSNRAVSGVVISDRDANRAVNSSSNRGLDQFFAQSAAREALRARDETFLARRALDDATALARRGAVSEADLPTLSPEEALELLNLRLELLRNLSRTPAQREAAREEIRAIEARYAALLKRQTEAQAARLRAATLDIPNRLRREGLLQIERQARITARKQADLRRELAQETRALARRDFASLPALQVELPKVRPLSSTGISRSFAPSAPQPPAEFFETARLGRASNAPLEAQRTDSIQNRAQIVVRLRRQARFEALQWARRAASNLGGTWSQSKTAPDRTQSALEILFPTTSRPKRN